MVKSVFRKGTFIGFLVLALLGIFCGYFTYFMISVHFFKNDLLRSTLTNEESVIFICLFGCLTFFIIRILLVHPVSITIDPTNQKLVFTNVFFLIKRSYSFSDFDYYFETVEHSIGDSSKAIYLVKNEKRERAIRGYYYSNTNEMKKALNGIPDHGFKKLGRLKVLLLYFRRNF